MQRVEFGAASFVGDDGALLMVVYHYSRVIVVRKPFTRWHLSSLRTLSPTSALWTGKGDDLLSLLSSFIGVLPAVCMLFVVSGCAKKKPKQPDPAGAKSGPQQGNGTKPTENPPVAAAPPAAKPAAPTGPTPPGAPPAAAPAAAGDIVDEGGDNYEDVNIGGGEPPPPA